MPAISNTALSQLFALRYYPNPEDDGPLGPGGPVMHIIAAGPHPEPWVVGPGVPWKVGLLTRATISKAVEQYETAGIIIVSGAGGPIAERIDARLRAYVDAICPPPIKIKLPPPRPWPWGTGFDIDPDTIDPAALIVAGAQFQLAADATEIDHPLRQVFTDSAERLFEVGIERLEQAAACGEPQLAGSAG